MDIRNETRPSASDNHSLRDLGAFEQWFYMFTRLYPCSFTLTVHLSGSEEVLAIDNVRAAAHQLQMIHPLLSAGVRTKTDGKGVEFFHRSTPARVGAVLSTLSWENVVAEEQMTLFDPTEDVFWRVGVQKPSDNSGNASTTIFLTFDHSITDGMGGVLVARDLIALLNGTTPDKREIPPAQEDLIGALQADEPPTSIEQAAPDERMNVVGSLRPWDNTAPDVTSATLDVAATVRLRLFARQAGVSVHAVLIAAATVVLARSGRSFVRVITPKDLRRNLGLNDDVALRLMPSRTGAAPSQEPDGDEILRIAREVHQTLADDRLASVVQATSSVMSQLVPSDPEAGANGMLAISSMDMMLTNLGELDFPAGPNVQVHGFRGLGMTGRIAGEQILGVSTFNGELHMTNVTYDIIPGLLDQITDVLCLCHR